ncbi:MAG: hypothetical protein JWN10_1879 [Solirubrobacterales bacterium]|nr:hypothetical protein [Solirubrobacterales bacterium]
MRGYRTKQAWGLPALALTGLVLALPLAAWAAAPPATGPAAPTVSTRPARVSGSSVLLEGTVNPHTLATTYYFQYGPTSAYGQQTAVGTLPASSTASASAKVSEPAAGIKEGFHYRVVATNSLGTREGHDRVFTNKTKTKSKKPAFVLPKTFAAIPLGSEFVLSGTLTGAKNGGREIALQASAYPYKTGFVNVGAPLLTSATGAFSFHVANMRSSTKFRVVTVGGVPVLTSLIVPAQVEAHVVLKVRSSSHKGLYRLYGTVTPAEVGAHVLVQLEKPPAEEKAENSEKPSKLEKPGKGGSEKEEKGPTFATKFKAVVKAGTKSLSRFSVVVDIAATGHYRVLVQIPPGPLVSGHSTTVLLHAHATAKGKKKKQT